MRGFVLGGVVTLAAGALAVFLIAWSGVVDASAARATPTMDSLLDWASARSIARHAPRQKNPLPPSPETLNRGKEHYQHMCVDCHGGPGAHPEEFAQGLHPSAPDLSSPDSQELTDGEMYWIVARGIHSTAMPSFERTHTPEDLWAIVAFIRSLPHAEPPPAASAPAPAAAERTVRISSFKFDPPTLEVHPGDAVTWTNEDIVVHTASAREEHGFDTGDIPAGQSRSLVLKAKGTFPYSCRYHPKMHGTLVVQ